MQSFSQRDPRWADMKMGASHLTLGRYGCTTTCIADLSTYFGGEMNPAQTCKAVKYTKEGLIIWDSCRFEKFQFWSREFGRNDINIRNALADPNLAVILQVANQSHWVVATGRELFSSIFKIADPFFGDRSTMRRYGNNITGAAYFRRE
jgi:hypothetical protein